MDRCSSSGQAKLTSLTAIKASFLSLQKQSLGNYLQASAQTTRIETPTLGVA